MNSILFIYSFYGVGGAQRRAANIANYLVDNGLNVRILALWGNNGTIGDENFFSLRNSIQVDLLDEYINSSNDSKINASLRSDARSLKRLKKLSNLLNSLKFDSTSVTNKYNELKKYKELKAYLSVLEPSLIINFGFSIFETTFLASRGMKHKICYVETNAKDNHSWLPNYTSVLEMIKSADAWVFQTKEEAWEHGKKESDRNTAIIYNPLKEDLPGRFTGERRKVIVNFCAMKDHKNLPLLIEAFSLLPGDCDEYELYLYCDSPASHESKVYKSITDKIHEKSLEERVKILPMSSDVLEKILDCSMFVSSSDYEGLSNSMLEAMAIGLPCVCTDCGGGGAREMIIDGENGFLVPVRDVEALRDAMLKFVREPDLAEKCGTNALRIREKLSDEIIYPQWLELIRGIG